MAVEIFELSTDGENGTGVDGNKLFGIGVIFASISLFRLLCDGSIVDDETFTLFPICGI